MVRTLKPGEVKVAYYRGTCGFCAAEVEADGDSIEEYNAGPTKRKRCHCPTVGCDHMILVEYHEARAC